MIWMRSFSGLAVPLADPQARHIRLADIAHHLALINRYCGATHLPYSVAQHSVLVARQLAIKGEAAPVQLWGLLHDAHEAYIGDITSPVAAHIAGADGTGLDSPLSLLKARLDAAVQRHFGLGLIPDTARAAVDQADKALFAAEWRCLMPGPCPGPAIIPARIAVQPWAWPRAEEEFLKAFNHLALACGLAPQHTREN